MEKRQEQTFIMIKPDGVSRGLVGQVLQRFESRGFFLVGMKLVKPSKDVFERHYEEHKARPFFPSLLSYVMTGPVVAMVFQGQDVVRASRKMIGETKPLESNPGTIRGDFCIDMGRNLIHGSDSIESAKREIGIWFKPEEIVEPFRADVNMLYE